MIKAFMFDYGGVLAEEGFRNGLMEIARKNHLDPEPFFRSAEEMIYDTGYLTGSAGEAAYWEALRQKTGISGTDAALREAILGRFLLRPRMIACVDALHARGFSTTLLSDQTNWLDELDRQSALFGHFDGVFNSFRTGRSKREVGTFLFVCNQLNVKPEETVFIDDNTGHIERAARTGMRTIHYTSFEFCCEQIARFTGVQCL